MIRDVGLEGCKGTICFYDMDGEGDGGGREGLGGIVRPFWEDEDGWSRLGPGVCNCIREVL